MNATNIDTKVVLFNAIYALILCAIINSTNNLLFQCFLIFLFLMFYQTALGLISSEYFDPCRGIPEQHCRQNPSCAVDYTPEGAVCFTSGKARRLIPKNDVNRIGYM